MEDCYKILGVSPTASAAEIKRAYRLKAKKLHPDLSEHAEESDEFRTLVRAYEILSDVHQRAIFDSSFAMHARYTPGSRSENTFDYRQWLVERTDPESKCKLIFFDLMHSREADAVALFKKMNTETAGFSLSRWFSRENFMDYGFILAEELVLAREYYDAALLLEKIIKMEFTFPYFRHFFPEVQKLAKDVLMRDIPGNVSDELAIDAWERALELGFPSKTEAFFLIKMAEAYDRLGDTATACLCLDEAVRLDGSTVIPTALRKKMEIFQ